MGHTFDRTDLKLDPASAGVPPLSPMPSAAEVAEGSGRTPLTFPFPMQAGALPLDEPEAPPSRLAG